MATAASPTRIDRLRDGEQRVVLRNIDWATYELLCDRLAGQPQRLTYDRGVLEIMSPSSRHELYNIRSGQFVIEVALGLDAIEAFNAYGATTWKRVALQRGLEADQCFYLDAAKLELLAGRLPDRPDDPLPDLAIEIEISHTALDKMEVYAGLGIPEVWRCDGEVATFERLGPHGVYRPAEASLFLPVRPDDLLQWLWEAEGTNLKDWLLRLRAWVRDELSGRAHPGAG